VGYQQGALEIRMTDTLPDPGFWRGKRVFLTGHTGFKGAWLTMWLHRLGADVTGFALPAGEPSLYADAGIGRLARSVIGDIRDRQALQAALRAAEPQVVLHLAAQALVRPSYQQPVETFATNVMGTVHLLEAACAVPDVRAVVVVTTDKVYENREWAWAYRETDALGGHDPYSASKACAEVVTSAWRRSFLGAHSGRPTVNLATARAGNVIGGGDWSADRLVPDCIRAFSVGQSVAIRNPASTRPWQHVLEPLCGYLLLAERLHAGESDFPDAFNFGPALDDVLPVTKVVAGLARAWGEDASWHVTAGDHPHEAGFLAVDPALARARLGWRPRQRLAGALEWTGRWYRHHAAGQDAAALIDADIQQYMTLGVDP